MNAKDDQQIELWNGPSGIRWAEHFGLTDRAFGVFGDAAIKRLSPQIGERILDVGCGAGTSVLQLAQAVGGAGAVHGVDASAALIAMASERCASLPGVSLDCVNAATADLGSDYDAVFSSFGTMFFQHPEAAFANLGHALVYGGRLVLTCWQSAAQNHWCSRLLDAVLPLTGEPAPAAPGRAPGTFAFAEASYLEQLLDGAGFANIHIENSELPVPMGHGTVEQAVDFALRIGPAASLSERQSPRVQAQIRERLALFFETEAKPDGVSTPVTLPGAAWIVTATRP